MKIRGKFEGPVWALGAMSGTSMDGVDAALLYTDGEDIVAFGETGYRAYDKTEQSAIRRALGQWPGEDGVAEAAEVVETAHAELLSRFKARLIGFHGQTIAHDPGGNGTHQVGDGAVLADVLGTPVAWDFRSADVALGGQGAPLASFYHHACARWAGLIEPVAFLNLGGVGNLTWLDPTAPVEDCMAFDTGPANGPIDDLMMARRGMARDEGGALAQSGTADSGVVDAALRHPYFRLPAPKSLDRSDFAGLADDVSRLSDADAAATLVAIVAHSVAKGLEICPARPARVLVTGGGRKNTAMMQALSEVLPCDLAPVEEIGLDGDMLEAQAFAYLAVRVKRGLPTTAPGTTGVAGAVGGGVVSVPTG